MRQIWIASILLSTALGSPAVTLGRHSGAVLIGRPLDIKVQAIAGANEDLTTQCVQADVFFGDTQIGPASVRTSIQRHATDAEASVRIQTTAPVNEPIVSVLVKAGCAAVFSRRYVMLADPLSEPASVAATGPESSAVAVTRRIESRPLPTLPVAPATREDGGTRRAAVSSAGQVAAAGAAQSTPQATPGSKPGRASRPASVVRRPPEPRKEVVPRLQLDPVDTSLAIERDPVLRLSLSLLSEPSGNGQDRTAAAQLWKALNASPEEILRGSQKLAVLEAEAKGLREQEVRNKAALHAMASEIEENRLMLWIAYVLGALLLTSLVAVFWLWRRRSGPDAEAGRKSWWAAGHAKADGPAVAKKPASARAKSVDLDLDLDLGAESGLDDLHVLPGDASEREAALLSPVERREFPASQMGVSRSVATEELFDVQQQSDFFVSLGEHDQAIGVLKTHIAESLEPSALAYLDLFKLYHKLGKRDDYDKLRAEFNHQFNAGAPPFDQYSDQSRGLESYETAFGRVQALWPQPRVLDVIENSIFRDAFDEEAEVFDLEAYRELLLLHAIAKDVIKRDVSDGPSDFQQTSIRPLKAAGVVAVSAGAVDDRNTQPLDDIPYPSPRLGLDVDLDALQEASAFEASLPEVPVPVASTSQPSFAASGDEPGSDNLIDFEVLDFVHPDEDGPAKTG